MNRLNTRRHWLLAAGALQAIALLAPAAKGQGSRAAVMPAGPGISGVLQERDQRFHPVWGPRGMVAAGEPLAAEAGVGMLRAGGNAVDAAVATSFALSVSLPHATGLGGGGFLLLWLPGRSPARARIHRSECREALTRELRLGGGTAVGVDFRETAPAAARPDLFLDATGQVDRQRATRSLQSTAVPGTVAGLLLAQRCYGRLPLAQVIAPAIALARQGLPVSRPFSQSLQAAAALLQADPASRALFFPAGRPLGPGQRLVQPELAASLERIARGGRAGFYAGPTAAALLQRMRRGDGLITAADLRAYRPRPVTPLRIAFRGHPVLALPPPAGGLTLLQLLRLLEPLNPADQGLNSAASLHIMAEAMNLAYQQRNSLLGDPGATPLAAERFLGDGAIAALQAKINLHRHRSAAELQALPLLPEGPDTTHLSVADGEGGLVALTSSINFAYGNGITVPGAGFLLNNQMDDFSARPGSANAFGLVQGRANGIAPGRRPLSSMTPTLVFRPDGAPWIAIGSPGGSRIITSVLQVLLNRLVHGLNLAAAVAAPRIHSQLLPDRIDWEEGISADTRVRLVQLGHALKRSAAMGAVQAVELLQRRDGGGSFGVNDPRRAWALAQPQ
jgi:gamma-glutamyltranspeptidase/glutathione hydrolase